MLTENAHRSCTIDDLHFPRNSAVQIRILLGSGAQSKYLPEPRKWFTDVFAVRDNKLF